MLRCSGILAIVIALFCGIVRVRMLCAPQPIISKLIQAKNYATPPTPDSLDDVMIRAQAMMDSDDSAAQWRREASAIAGWGGLLLTGIAGVATASIGGTPDEQKAKAESTHLLRGIAVILAIASATHLVSERLDSEIASLTSASNRVFDSLSKADLGQMDKDTDALKQAKALEILKLDLLRAIRSS
jgi:hypothetical protein